MINFALSEATKEPQKAGKGTTTGPVFRRLSVFLSRFRIWDRSGAP
jgi:hypothetical protein